MQDSASTTAPGGVNRDSVIAAIGELAVTPRVIRHMAVFLGSPDADIRPALEAMRTEPVLTTALLAAGNTPSHSRGQKLLTVDAAVLRLGFRETYRIALLVTFRQGLRIPGLPDSRIADHLWSRAVTTACAMEKLTLDPAQREFAYTVGLLHLIGAFVLARNAVLEGLWDPTHPASLQRVLEASMGADFPEAGGIALRHWDFPEEIWVPVKHQLTPGSARGHTTVTARLASAVRLASWIEEARPDSLAFRRHSWGQPPPDAQLRAIEAASVRLLDAFYSRPPRRPEWVGRPEGG